MPEDNRDISLKIKIMLATLVPVTISIGLICTVVFVSLFNSLAETAKADFLQLSKKYSVSFESKINNAMNYLSIVAKTLETQIEMGFVDRELLQKTVMEIFDGYELIDGSSIYFEPDMYDGKDAEYIGTEYGTAASGRICYYFYLNDGETAYLPEALENDIEFTLPHYTKAKEANAPIYTEPVTYEIHGKNIPMFTLTYPIHDVDGVFIGAVTVDLFLEDIYAQLQEEVIYETGYIVIVNGDNYVIYSPKFEDIGKTREETGLRYELQKEGVSFLNAVSIINGKETFVTVSPIYIPQLDDYFYISVAAPIDEINAAGTRLITVLVFFSLFLVAAIGILVYCLVGKITAPIKDITENVDKIAGGDYNARITGDYRGEFGVVKYSVNAMADSIEAYVKESKNSLNILTNILDGMDAFIYVTDPDTDIVLFINEPMKRHFNITDNGVGNYCYEILQDGRVSRCEFCPCEKLEKDPNSVVVWEEHSPVTGRDYRNTDCYIEWLGGTLVHLQHSVDITDINKLADEKLDAERAALEMKHEKEKAESAAQAKTRFLAKMSHEIRTPMNAVSGMTELILRKELPQDVYESAMVIKAASSNLLSIINDILDFSKIEAGMLEIVEGEYLLPSLINDAINVTRIRLVDAPIQFTVYVDPNVPSVLTGDEVRIRQTIINMLSNAVKYTEEGFISLTVTSLTNDNNAVLTFDIADSGIGIKQEDMDRLFGDFVQFDIERNKGVEGTGLGLAISLSLCQAMGGDVTAKSEYGKGSVFTVTLPQTFEAYRPFAAVDTPSEKSVLLYETRRYYRESIERALDSLGVNYESVESIPQLFESIADHPYVFISSFMYGSVGPVLTELDEPPVLVLLSDITDTTISKDAKMLTMPAHSLSIANILNDVQEEYDTSAAVGASFTAAEAKVLIVDDIAANLKVGEGLLLPYEMQVTLCMSGREAIELISKNRYDLVFMDHMMPEMDGIEATRQIREMEGEYFKSLPIVALTANAVSGVREMFVQNGMNDFLAKPIDIAKLNTILERWIPKSKRMKPKAMEEQEHSAFVESLRAVPALNVKKALSVMGGIHKIYERAVRLSADLLPDDIAALDKLIDNDLPNYSIAVHGMKGVLNNIGAYGLGKTALKLEELSKEGDVEGCRLIHSDFIVELTDFSKALLELTKGADDEQKPMGDEAVLKDGLQKLIEAADFFDSLTAFEILQSLREYSYGQAIDDGLAELKRAFEMMDYDAAIKLAKDMGGELKQNG